MSVAAATGGRDYVAATDKLWIGIDYSISSPAMAVMSAPAATQSLTSSSSSDRVIAARIHFLPQRRREIGLVALIPPSAAEASSSASSASSSNDGGGVVEVVAWPPMTDSTCPEHRYHRLAELIVTTIETERTRLGITDPGRVGIAVEGYAMGMVGSSSMTRLCEAGGVLRNRLWAGGYRFVNVPPAANKKAFCHRGNATKAEMLRDGWIRRLGLPDPGRALGFDRSILPTVAPQMLDGAYVDGSYVDDGGGGDDMSSLDRMDRKTPVPKPVEDVVDALSLAVLLGGHCRFRRIRPGDDTADTRPPTQQRRQRRVVAGAKRKRAPIRRPPHAAASTTAATDVYGRIVD